jgi:hypothetical protein
MNNNLESNKEERKQLQKELLGKIGSFLKRRWKIVLIVLVASAIVDAVINPSTDFQEGVEKGKQITEKKEENKVDEVKEPEAEVEPVKEETPEEKEAREKKEQEEARTATIEKQFSLWNGEHVKLTRVIKEIMNNPDSYKHVKTGYFDMGDHIIINTTFRGENAFGGTITSTAKGKASLDGETVELLELDGETL